MNAFSGLQLSWKLCHSARRTLIYGVKNVPYWRSKFPDRIAPFEEIPTVSESYDLRKMPQVAEGWYKKYGHVVKQQVPSGKYTVHLFHFDDFYTIYNNDGFRPIRQSHQVIAQYRKERKHLYDKVGLGPGNDEEWLNLRETLASFIASNIDNEANNRMLEQVVDDLIKIIQNNVNAKGEIELLPWLHRWAFESIGVVTLHKRVEALSESDNEKADKLVEAAALSDEIIFLTTNDPVTDYEERYRQLAEAQDFIYSELRKYLDDIKKEMGPESDSIAQLLLKNKSCSENDAITVFLDLFQGALQTASLTALMTLYNLARHPDVQAKLRREVKQRMPTKDSKYEDTYSYHDYLRKVIYEALRLNPPIIGNGRVIQKDLVLGGYSVPAKTNVLLHFQVPSLQAEFYEDPLKFKPEGRNHHLIQFVFGGSRRMCPGKAFALRQLDRIVAKLIRHFDFSYDGGEVSMINQLHNRPEKPLILRVKPVEE